MFSKSAVYYDAIYAARGKDYAREAEMIHGVIRQYRRSAGNALLDVGCGTGGHIRHLKKYYEVTGLDLDLNILAVAHQALPGVVFHRGDMSDFWLDRKFDAIVCLFGSIGYVKTVERLQQTLRNFAQHLAPGGVAVVEPWFPPGILEPGTVHATFVDEPQLKVARMNVHALAGNVSILDFHYLVATPEGVEHFTESHELGLFTHDEYLSAFHDSGLKTYHDEKGVDGRGLYIGAGSQ